MLKGRLRWANRRRLTPQEASKFSTSVETFKAMRMWGAKARFVTNLIWFLCDSQFDESYVQGDGGYLIVMERIANAKQDMTDQVSIADQLACRRE